MNCAVSAPRKQIWVAVFFCIYLSLQILGGSFIGDFSSPKNLKKNHSHFVQRLPRSLHARIETGCPVPHPLIQAQDGSPEGHLTL